jgi:hypothetical protein
MDQVGEVITFPFNTCAVVFIQQELSTGLGHFDAWHIFNILRKGRKRFIECRFIESFNAIRADQNAEFHVEWLMSSVTHVAHIVFGDQLSYCSIYEPDLVIHCQLYSRERDNSPGSCRSFSQEITVQLKAKRTQPFNVTFPASYVLSFLQMTDVLLVWFSWFSYFWLSRNTCFSWLKCDYCVFLMLAWRFGLNYTVISWENDLTKSTSEELSLSLLACRDIFAYYFNFLFYFQLLGFLLLAIGIFVQFAQEYINTALKIMTDELKKQGMAEVSSHK